MSFESRLLYEQHSAAEEGTSVLTSIYAILWTYPGAMTKTSARIRTTFVYQTMKSEVMILGGTIEKWRNEGWGLLDEYHDTISVFGTLEECKKRLINMAESFLMGKPLEEVDEDYFPTSSPPQSTPASGKPSQPNLKIIDYQSKKTKNKDKKKSKEKSKKDDDFDWI